MMWHLGAHSPATSICGTAYFTLQTSGELLSPSLWVDLLTLLEPDEV